MLASQGSSDCFSSIHTFLEKQNIKRSIENEFGYGQPPPPVESRHTTVEERFDIQIVQPAKPSQPLLKAEIFEMQRDNDHNRQTFRANDESRFEIQHYQQGSTPKQTPGFQEQTFKWRQEEADTKKHNRDPSSTKEEIEKSKELKLVTLTKELNQSYASQFKLAEQQKNVKYYMDRLHELIEKEQKVKTHNYELKEQIKKLEFDLINERRSNAGNHTNYELRQKIIKLENDLKKERSLNSELKLNMSTM